MRWYHISLVFVLSFLLFDTISFAVDITVTVTPILPTNPIIISNINPINNSIHVEIYDNPPDGSGYVNLSWQLNNTNGHAMEFYMDIWNGSSWVNRIHLTDQNNGTWYHHEDTFNTTNTTYYWRLHVRDEITNVWNNKTFNFRTDAIPNPPSNPQPINGSIFEAGNDITLAVKVNHPDASAGAVIHNVSFYEYPSGRLIGWNYSSSGFIDGSIVKCNQTYHLEYSGTTYYWYAKCKDDEYWSDSSDIYYIYTYYNDTEPSIIYYSIGSQIYINPTYNESEPNVVYYGIGASIKVYGKPSYYNISPNGTINEPLSVKLTVYVNKTGDENYWNFTFLTNCTANCSWKEIGEVNNVKVLNSSLVEVSLWWSGLDWNTTYYWRVIAYNSTIDAYSNSSVYSFKTILTDTELNTSYYSIGSQIYVKPVYNESEPNVVYYSLGSQINVYNIANLSNPYPSNGSMNVWLSTPLRIDVNKTGNASQLYIIFETNCTANGSWIEIGRITQVFPPNATVQIWWSGLDWNTTYYWRVIAYNSTTGITQYSDIYHFTTLQSDEEINITYYNIGSQIYTKPLYTTSEPYIVYYDIGSYVPISKPYPQDPIPPNNKDHGKNNRNFSVYIYDVLDNDTIDKVEFYIDGNKYDEVLNVTANTRATIHVSGLSNYTWHTWYVKVYDDNWVVTSDTWNYKPANSPPVVNEDPLNGSTNVAVYRKLVSGEWRHFVRLYWNLTDDDGDGMSFILWTKDPSTGTWIQRWTILDYSIHNGSYYYDEELFNETGKTYYWRVWSSDRYNETNQTFNFFTQFFIDFWWTPECPTNDDTVHFYSLTEGADDFRWDFGDGTNVTGVNETTHRYLVAGYYNVTLWVYNATNHVWGHLTKTIRIDRNVTLLTPKEGNAGYNWFAWQGSTINASRLSELLNLSRGYWIHYYNSTSDEWEGYFVGYNAGINFNIDNWDASVIVVGRNITKRINVTDMHNYSTKNKTFVKTGYNIVSWSIYSEKNASELPLENNEWVYKYDTVNRTWLAYLKGVGGDDFKVSPYDVIVTYLMSSRWWDLMFGG